MGKTRRVSVFEVKYEGTGSEGISIYDQVDENTISANGVAPSIIDAENLWPLLRIFVQFSREVHGGDLKRLVFRSPEAYAAQSHRFEPSQHPPQAAPVFVVHVAHDPKFVVAVTERLSSEATAASALLSVPDDSQSHALSISQFCTSILDFLRGHTEKSLERKKNHPEDSRTSNLSLDGLTSVHQTALAPTNNSSRDDMGPGHGNKLSTAIDVSKLSEFISHSQNLLDT